MGCLKSFRMGMIIHVMMIYVMVDSIIKGLPAVKIDCNSTDAFSCVFSDDCISKDLHCDGKDDCGDNSDETFCASSCSGEGWFQCKNGHCISVHWLCDGEDDCMDWSDEESCKTSASKTPLNYTCHGDDFQCGDGLCLPQSWKCDGQTDCRDGDDEDDINCSGEDIRTCGKLFTCGDGSCIPHSWVCDGDPDCTQDKMDEVDCGRERNNTDSCLLEEGWFPCEDGSRCLEPRHVCDSISQCSDQSDEGDFCLATANCTSIHCSNGCIKSQNGPQCFCNRGYKPQASGNCVDVDECAEFGRCSQKCVNSGGGFSCRCIDGYTLNLNNSCVASDGGAILFFSTKTEVRGMKLDGDMQYFPIAEDLEHVVGVGFDSMKGQVYWTDVAPGKERLVATRLDGSTPQDIITNGLDMPEDLVVDEVNRNVYFTDSVRRHVAVCSLDHSGCTVLVAGIEQPRAIAIHHSSKQVLYTDWGSKPAIVQLSMDGSNKKNLVDNDVSWPNGLAVDQVLDRIYWSDAKKDTIESIRLDGTDRRLILDMIDKHPFSLAVFEDSLYWSDWALQEIVSCNKFNGKNFRTLVKEAGLHPMGITIAHPLLSRAGELSPCSNSPCSHVCLPGVIPNKFECRCPSHLDLDEAGHSCIERSSKPNILHLATSSNIYEVFPRSIGTSSWSQVFTSPPRSFIVDLDSSSYDIVYFVNRGSEKGIGSYEGSSGVIKQVATGDQFGAISVDPMSFNMFWVDIHKMDVMVHSLKTGKNVEILKSNSSTLAIKFVPEKNRLIVAEKGRLTIMQCAAGISKIVLSSDIVSPNSIAFSAEEDVVYIGDSEGKAIWQWKWGSDGIGHFKLGIGEVSSVAVVDGVLYWLQKSFNTLFWINLSNVEDISWMSLEGIASSNDVLALSVGKLEYNTRRNFDCLTSHCSDMCLPHDDQGYKCVCTYGAQLGKDLHTCEEHCPSNVFSCGDGQCVPYDWFCDGSSDCVNERDEANCSLVISHPMISQDQKSNADHNVFQNESSSVSRFAKSYDDQMKEHPMSKMEENGSYDGQNSDTVGVKKGRLNEEAGINKVDINRKETMTDDDNNIELEIVRGTSLVEKSRTDSYEYSERSSHQNSSSLEMSGENGNDVPDMKTFGEDRSKNSQILIGEKYPDVSVDEMKNEDAFEAVIKDRSKASQILSGEKHPEVEVQEVEGQDNSGAVVGIVVTLLVAGLLIIMIYFGRKYLGSKKKLSDDVMFTSVGSSWPERDLECGRVEIISKNNPVKDDASGTKGVYAEKDTSSHKSSDGQDNDSAYQECSIAASSADSRHFSVDDDEDEPSSYDDRRRLL